MGQRGPKPMPANVHALRGNMRAAAALADGIHPPVEIPGCPKWLQDEARKEWRRIGAQLHALGLVSQLDRAVLASYCAAWAEFAHAEQKIAALNAADPAGEAGLVETTPNGFRVKSVWASIRDRAEERMQKAAALFGMSPSARTRVTASSAMPDLFDGTDHAKPASIAQFRS